ncbi:MAG: TetR/AcrR family transcriptional regulator [Gammaproteobacteria bacterium]|nr:TetR/AcrR family transcriptional regulator [Gammaproteobacteria bacterium]
MQKKRKYTLRQRAARQEQTRERIVEAAMKLHEERGPADTTISAIAEQAGVQRLTVYRHFPSEDEIFGACTARYMGLHPPPDVSRVGQEDAAQHTRAVLLALYGYYRETQGMWTVAYRDLDKVPALEEPMAEFEGYLGSVADRLVAVWGGPRKSKQSKQSKRLRATAAHAVAFSTWRSLSGQGLGSRTMADLVCGWIRAASLTG